MDNDNHTAWERFLTPDILRPHLISASVYVTGFEMLVESITERVKQFYCPRFDESESIDPKYEIDVLSRNKSPLYASLQWWKEVGAISDEDIARFTRVKDLRNLITHEMPKLLIKGLPPDIKKSFNDIVLLLDKIEKWWFINIEAPTNQDLDGKNIEVKDIIPGKIASLNVLLDVALGSDEEAMRYIEILNNSE